MSRTLDQIYIANPITTNASTDLMYFAQSPYTANHDAGMTYADFALQFATPLQTQKSAFNFHAASGINDAFIVNLSPAVLSYTDGLIVTMDAATLSNTTTTPTLAVNALAAKNIVTYWGNPAVGDIAAHGTYLFIYNATNDNFELINPTISTANTTFVQFNSYNTATDSGTANAYVATLVPAVTAINNSLQVNLVISNPNTTASTLTVNGLTKSICLSNNAALSGGELVAGQNAFFIYSGTYDKFILLNPANAASTSGTVASITGTANQVLANGTSGSAQTGAVTLTLPQDIATTSTPTFLGATLGASGLTNGYFFKGSNLGYLFGGANFIAGTSSSITTMQIGENNTITNLILSGQSTSGPTSAQIALYRSRATTLSGHAAVQSGDSLGHHYFLGDDGTNYKTGAVISATVIGPVSTGILPTELGFSTTNSSGGTVQGMTLSPDQILTLTNPLPVGSGGTNKSSFTTYTPIVGGTTSTGALQQMASAGTAGQLMSSAGASAVPVWTTATFANTYTASNLLYSNGANNVTGLATANSSVLVTNGSGVPSLSTTLPSGIAATNMNLTTPTLGVASATSINFGGSALGNYNATTAQTAPTITFVTPGDLSVAYTTQKLYYSRIGSIVTVSFTLQFTPTFTTASGALIISNIPVNANANTDFFGSCNHYSNITYSAGYTTLLTLIPAGANTINFIQNGSGKNSLTLQASNMPSGGVVVLQGTITYMV